MPPEPLAFDSSRASRATGPDHHPVARAVPPERIFQQVRDALANLYDVPYLETHPLARLLPAQPRAGRPSSGEALRRQILDCIEALRPPDPAATREARAHRLMTLEEAAELAMKEPADG